jgi:hypothetical protein
MILCNISPNNSSRIGIFIPISMLDDNNNASSSSSSSLSSLSYHTISRAQDKEDIYALENWYWDHHYGTILESGALNGIEFSTSLVFEKLLNWKAIHIEASPDSFHDLKNNRPNSLNIHAALCNQTRTLHFLNNKGNLAVSGIYEYLKVDYATTTTTAITTTTIFNFDHHNIILIIIITILIVIITIIIIIIMTRNHSSKCGMQIGINYIKKVK